ncbi:rust resistance kinase Lr10-like [Syzygium oleosum]|uniref:rust resistance kinase Lr10-like n=1 Tax=Syzygium oleosum TaxID=219896 RepID=UPI0024BA4573|nr:rust resistance kinase Lr10-like [Syzygium oleosum]
MLSSIPSLFFFFFLCFADGTAHHTAPTQDPCDPTSCSGRGPQVQFPFRLAPFQPANCSFHPEFDLSCDRHGNTLLLLPNTTRRLFVKSIDYANRSVVVQDPKRCLPLLLANLNLSRFSYQRLYKNDPYGYQYGYYNYTLFKCPPPERTSMTPVVCLSIPGSYEVYAVRSSFYVGDLPLVSCERNGNIDALPTEIETMMIEVRLAWDKPDCQKCTDVNWWCRPNGSDIRCTEPRRKHYEKLRAEIAGGVVGSFFLLAVVIGVGYVLNERRRDKAFQLKIESFLHDYEALKPTRYSYNDIKRITNDFEEKLGQGAYGTVYKGKLSNEIFVAVKMLDNSFGKGEEFINEVGTMGRIHHVNVVRMVGFCADGFRRALVYEFLPNESLEKFIFPGEDALDAALSWERLHDIALGVAKGIEYLHQGCDHRILHFDIKPHNILLDDNFNPKIADFGLAKLCSKEKSAVSMTAARGTMGYIAPEVFSRNFGSVSSKSDVYSFGMLLLEMVGGRKNVDVNAKNMSQMYFPQWVYNHLNKGEELEIRIREDGDHKIARKLAIVGLWCIHWYPADRPPMKVVVQMLEGEECPIMPKNPFVSSGSGDAATMQGRLWNTDLKVIAE